MKIRTFSSRNMALIAVSMLAGAHAAWAQIITTDSSLPPAGVYVASGVGPVYAVPGLPTVLSSAQLEPPAGTPVVSVVGGGANELEQFTDTLLALISINGAAPVPIALTGQVTTETFLKPGNTLGTFGTQMLQMDLSGPNGLMIRQSSSTASTGQTTISDIGGGQFQISSFFDVFTELSLDSGQTWTPSQQGTILTLAPVPEPSTMIAGALLLLPFGLQGIRKLRNSRQQVA